MKSKIPGRPLLRYHGGKWRLARWIISHFPCHQIYVEPFGGAASVLLLKEPCYSEIYNDLDGEIVNLFRMMRERGGTLLRAVAMTPYARTEFDRSYEPSGDPVEQARRTLVRSFMGFGGNLTRLTKGGAMERTGFRGYSKLERRTTPAHDWVNWPAEAQAIVERLRSVMIECRRAAEVILQHDGPDTLHYVDPPYVHATRAPGKRKKNGYRHEMTDAEHCQLGEILNKLQGKVVVSGYRCRLYDEMLRGWKRIDTRSLADGARERVESLWLSPNIREGER